MKRLFLIFVALCLIGTPNELIPRGGGGGFHGGGHVRAGSGSRHGASRSSRAHGFGHRYNHHHGHHGHKGWRRRVWRPGWGWGFWVGGWWYPWISGYSADYCYFYPEDPRCNTFDEEDSDNEYETEDNWFFDDEGE